MTAEHSPASIASVLAALHRGRDEVDADGVGRLLTDDVEHFWPSSFRAEPVVGRKAVAEGLTTGVARFFDVSTLQRRIVRTTIAGGVAAVEQELTARTADGRPYQNRYVWIYEFEGLQIRRMIEHADTLWAARQMGIVPETTGAP